LLTEIWLTPGGSSTVHIYTQTIHRTTLVGRISGIRTQSCQTKINDELNGKSAGHAPSLRVISSHLPCNWEKARKNLNQSSCHW